VLLWCFGPFDVVNRLGVYCRYLCFSNSSNFVLCVKNKIGCITLCCTSGWRTEENLPHMV